MAKRYAVDLKITRLLLQIGLMRARQGEFEDALCILRSVKAFRADLPHPASALALTHLYQGRLDDAERELDAVLSLFPAHQFAKALLGVVYREAGRSDWRNVLQEVIDDGRDEWAIGLARASLATDASSPAATPATSAPRASESPREHIPHAQRLYA
jgi:tetratricopeptide (TPR) repeat protein